MCILDNNVAWRAMPLAFKIRSKATVLLTIPWQLPCLGDLLDVPVLIQISCLWSNKIPIPFQIFVGFKVFLALYSIFYNPQLH